MNFAGLPKKCALIVRKAAQRFVGIKLKFTFAPEIKKKISFGTLTEWLGSGLQNRVQQFESAGYLTDERIKDADKASFIGFKNINKADALGICLIRIC